MNVSEALLGLGKLININNKVHCAPGGKINSVSLQRCRQPCYSPDMNVRAAACQEHIGCAVWEGDLEAQESVISPEIKAHSVLKSAG